MSDTKYYLWCYIEGDYDAFPIITSSTLFIGELKDKIKEKKGNLLQTVDAGSLTLSKVKVNVDLREVNDQISAGRYHLDASGRQRLVPVERISELWPEPPPHNLLHVFVRLPGVDSPTLVQEVGDKPVDSGLVQEYKDIFVKVNKWGVFEDDDIKRNALRNYGGTRVPEFVAEFERKLDSKPGLAPDAYDVFKSIRDTQFLDAYFGPLKRRMVEGQSPEEFTFESGSHRHAGHLELTHLAYIAAYDWGRYWYGDLGRILKEMSMNVIFFHCFAVQRGRTTTVLTSNQSWPFSLIAECEDIRPVYEQLGQYQPRSDLLVLKSSLPRLLVQVNSKPKKDMPEDLIRMLLLGAAIVRFANRFLETFMTNEDFVLFAIYIWDNGEVTRYSLFQEPNNPEVCYKKTSYWLNTSVERAKFVRQLYNFRHVLERAEETEDTEAEIQQLQNKINQHDKKYPMKSFHTKDYPGTNNTQGNKRKRRNSDVDDQGSGGGVSATDCAELGAHGYEVKPRTGDIVDEKGGVIKSYSKSNMMPSHILTVYQRSDPSERFMAKKVREESNELEFLKRLNTFQPKSEHIISLHESFQTQSTSWAILPEMDSVADYVSFVPHKLYGKVAQVCWGLIEGVAYLHKFCIAHRDIKPENLVVDREFCLKFIDFDVAIQVKNEHEVIDGQCGTKGWMAPEIEESSMYSPIKVDRWSTGQVLRYLLNLNKFGEEDTVLRMTARKLTARDPEQRSSMLQVAQSVSDVVNVVVERKASRSLQDTVGVDGENVKP